MDVLFYTLVGIDLNWSSLPQQLVNGLVVGSIYALIALGYTMVYGVLRLINFAHGEVFMLGAYTALLSSWVMGFSPDAIRAFYKSEAAKKLADPSYVEQAIPADPFNLVIMILLAMAMCAVIGAIIEFFAYRPMRNQSRTAALITAIGVSLLLQYAGSLFLPSSPPPSVAKEVNPYQANVSITLVPAPKEIRDKFEKSVGELTAAKESGADAETILELERTKNDLEGQVAATATAITMTQGKIVMLLTVLVLMAALRWLVLKTPAGRSMRAASHDFDSASLMGINVNRVVTFTFMLGSALAGAGAMMLVTFEGTSMQPFFGMAPGVKAFVAAVLGGIGNIPGAVLGGILMGLAETLVTWLGFSNYKDAVAFVILFIVLMFRPGGLLGSSKVEKV